MNRIGLTRNVVHVYSLSPIKDQSVATNYEGGSKLTAVGRRLHLMVLYNHIFNVRCDQIVTSPIYRTSLLICWALLGSGDGSRAGESGTRPLPVVSGVPLLWQRANPIVCFFTTCKSFTWLSVLRTIGLSKTRK